MQRAQGGHTEDISIDIEVEGKMKNAFFQDVQGCAKSCCA